MLDSLLGRNFTAKCKHSIKCISSRAEQIKRRKQARLRILRKDIAELLSLGRESDAFGRVDDLIAEVNHASCYDMIERYCDSILKQLPCMQKMRECPEDAMEAVSTLISAAERIPDLPELSDLRHEFKERYGSCMDLSVNLEFLEKLKKKPISVEDKLRLMREIAEEFSIAWDARAFQRKISWPPHPVSPQPNNGATPHKETDGRRLTTAGVRLDVQPKRGFEVNSRIDVQEDGTHPEPKDIHVIQSFNSFQSSRAAIYKHRKVFNEPEAGAVDPQFIRKAAFVESPTDKGSRTTKEEDGQAKAVRNKISYPAPPYTKPKTSKIEALVREGQVETSDYDDDGGGRENKEGSANNEKGDKARSVRSKAAKPLPPGAEGLDIGKRTEGDGVVMSRTPSGRGGRSDRGTSVAKDEAEGDEEERALDMLLLRHSKKATTLADPQAIGSRPEKAPRHSRAISLPPLELAIGDKSIKGPPSRTASFQGDSGSRRGGGHVHPLLPDYDQLAERVRALRMMD